MIVRTYMSTGVKTAHPHMALREAVALMRREGVRRLVVTEGPDVCGIVCHRDITRAAERLGTEKEVSQVREIMSAPVITIGQDEPIERAAQLMTLRHIGSLVVVNRGALAGIITESDIFRALTFLLAGRGNSARITFDITRGDETIEYLVKQTRAMGLSLRSFLTFEEGERLMAVARVRGDRMREFVDTLWESGHSVVNVVYLD